LLVITLIGGGAFYFLRSNESQAANQALDAAQQQITNVNSESPAPALKALASTQKTLAEESRCRGFRIYIRNLNVNSESPAPALKALASTQKTLAEVQKSYQLNDAQMQRLTQLRKDL